MRVRYSQEALEDLHSISDYLVARNPRVARAVEDKIKATIALLADFPGMGRAVEGPGLVRMMPIVRYPYLIFYALGADELFVLHIRHGARAPWQPEDL